MKRGAAMARNSLNPGVSSRSLACGRWVLQVAKGIVAGAALFVTAGLPLRAAEDIDLEFEYAAGLIEIGLPDYAQEAAARIAQLHPEVKDRVAVIRAQALIAARRFEEAEQILAPMPPDSPKAQAIRLAMADGYYRIENLERCRAIYDEVFSVYAEKLPTDPDLLRFYRDAAYKFGQMLERQDDHRGAAAKLDLVLATSPPKEMARQVRLELAELLLRAAAPEGVKVGKDADALLAKSKECCDEVLWGGTDVWFGRAITCLAQIEIAHGRREASTKLLQDNLRILKKIDDLLEEAGIPVSESPFAGARSLLGGLHEQSGDLLMAPVQVRQEAALKAFGEYLDALVQVWQLVVRINRRDKANVERFGAGAGMLPGTDSQRQQPFLDMTAALSELRKTYSNASGSEGWAAAVAKQAAAFRDRLTKQVSDVAKYPRELGVTPLEGMAVGEDFEGRVHLDKGLLYLSPQGRRKQEAALNYTRALREFYNVFVGYPNTVWRDRAGERVARLKDVLHEVTGREVIIEAREGGQRKIALVMLNEGHGLFARKKYADATREFLKGLNAYPEGPEAVVALAGLLECYVSLKDTLRVKMLADYIAERFVSDAAAPQILLRTGRLYFEQGDRPMYSYIYELYLSHFPRDSRAPMILYMLGEQRWKVEDYAAAVPYYERVVARYPSSTHAPKCLSRIGWSHYLRKDFAKAVEAFARLAEGSVHGKDKAQGKLCLADSYRQDQDYAQALKHYRELAGWLEQEGSLYRRSRHAELEYRGMLEQAVFFQAYCLGRIEEPADQVAAYRSEAVELYRAFADRFTSSSLAPTALSSLGAVLLGMGRSDEAAKAYEELAHRFPDSDVGKDARMAMIRSLVDVGQGAQARDVLEELLAEGGSEPDQLLRLGLLMMEKDERDSAALVFEGLLTRLAGSDDKQPGMVQRALFSLAEIHHGAGRHDEAAERLKELLDGFPNSALFYDARFMLARICGETGRPDEATEILREIFTRATDQVLINRATVALAGLQAANGNTADALASYQRIVLLADPEDPAMRPLFEESLGESVKLLGGMERWRDVLAHCEQYLAAFPSGAYAQDARDWRTKATVQLAATDEPAAPQGE